MKLLFDQNLSWRLVSFVSRHFPGSAHVNSLGLSNTSDREIWDYAKEHDFCICSKDTDFRQLSFLYGPPPKVIWLQVENRPTWEIAEILKSKIDRIMTFKDSPEAMLVIQALSND